MRNTTNQNKSKSARLSKEHVIPSQNVTNDSTREFLQDMLALSNTHSKQDILFAIGKSLAHHANDNDAYQSFLSSCAPEQEEDDISIDISDDVANEFDLLGTVYQFLNTKQENLSAGSFYTGITIAADMTKDLSFEHGETLFDPSCGSGAFLMASDAPCDQIIGVDADPIAVMIARFNYFIKFPDAPSPKIECEDFFKWVNEHSDDRFDYIIGNPPYGADIDDKHFDGSCITSGETFSLFIERCMPLVSDGGLLRFLIPESLLNVRRHSDVRDLILHNEDGINLSRIRNFKNKFSGVMSDIYMIELTKQRGEECAEIVYDSCDETCSIPIDIYEKMPYHLFTQLSDVDLSIIEKMEREAEHPLKQASYALGIVTGNNKTKVFDEPLGDTEPVITGKQIEPGSYIPLEAVKHLVYDRSSLQQVAPDELYRAPNKLIYKVICKDLLFVYDDSGSLTLNSANIVVPASDQDPIILLGLLNSKMMSFYHRKMFGGVNKVAKEDLQRMPFPVLSSEQRSTIRESVLSIISETSAQERKEAIAVLFEFLCNEIYRFTDNEIERIKSAI